MPTPQLCKPRTGIRICRQCQLHLLRGRSIIQSRSFASSLSPSADSAKAMQKNPLHGYYKLILNAPLTHPVPAPEILDTVQKAQIVFGSRLLGPAERKARQEDIDARSHVVNGVRIPPRPDEPDNCCMSGCVNCVWDLFRDEMEAWADKKKEAAAKGSDERPEELEQQPLFGDIPIGIREFMKTEKMLKQRHLQEGQPLSGL